MLRVRVHAAELLPIGSAGGGAGSVHGGRDLGRVPGRNGALVPALESRVHVLRRCARPRRGLHYILRVPHSDGEPAVPLINVARTRCMRRYRIPLFLPAAGADRVPTRCCFDRRRPVRQRASSVCGNLWPCP
jgi:hypothetical protein